MTSTTYAAWSTIAPITIANAPGVADYPVRIDLAYASPMAADFADIRFTDTDDNALSYWIESYTASTSAVVWVKVASGTTEIELVYGNAEATSESNADAVFDFYDGFTRDNSATVGAGWVETVGNNYLISSGKLQIGGIEDNVGCYHSAPTIAGSVAEFYIANIVDNTATARVSVYGPVANTKCTFAYYSNDLMYWNGSGWTVLIGNIGFGYHLCQIALAADSWAFRADSGSWITDIPYVTDAVSQRISFRPGAGGVSGLVDWVRLRKYQATEPVPTIGTAESNQTAVSESVEATLAFSGDGPATGTAEAALAFAAGLPPIVPSFTASPTTGTAPLTVQFTDTSEGYPEYFLWDFGDGVGGSAVQNPSYTYTAQGSYFVLLSVSRPDGGKTIMRPGAITVSGEAAGAGEAVAVIYLGGTVATADTAAGVGAASLALSGAAVAATASGAAASLAISGIGAASTPSHVGTASASLAFSGSSQHLHWIDFDTLPATTTTADPLTGYPVTYPSGTVAIPAVTASVRRGVSDVCWQLTETVDGVASIPITSLRATKVTRQDHNGTARCIFFGVVPGLTYHLAYQADATSANGYDYGWYLSQQYVPSAYRIMPATMNPSDFVTAMLGGTFWETATGVRPYRIATVTAWGTSVLPAKEFVFEPRTTKWEAIQQLAEYCGFVFFTKWIPVGVADVANPDPSQRVVQVNAVDFDAVEGTGYHDVDPVNLGGAYRTAEGVDIERFSTERGASVGWIRDGEWLKFTRTFDWSGRYAVSARVAAATEATATYWTLYLDDVEQFTVYVGAQTLANGGYRTGAYNIFTNTDPDKLTAAGVTVADAAQYIDIAEGEHVIKITFGGNVGAAPNNKHQNFTGLTLTPEGAGSAAGADTLYEPVAYWVADANIDSRAAGLDLPAPVVISDPGQYPRDGVEVMENANERYNSVTVRGHSESGVYFEYTASFVSDGLPREKFEESDRIVDAASAQTYALALLDYYKLDQKSYRLSLPQRFDLSLYQLITFVGHAKLPTTACRIVDVEHHSGHQDDWTTIEIVPNTTWLRGRKLRRMLFPSAVHETQAIVDHALASLPQPHIGVCATVGTDTGTFALEEGGTMTGDLRGV